MRHKTLTILVLISFFLATSSQAEVKILSPSAKISLLTCGPGDAVWSKFGHSALWVVDPVQKIDRVYNYGTFEFVAPDFFIEFIKGTALYHLSVSNIGNFYLEYESQNRSIIEQVLNLTEDEKQLLFEKLEENYLPENRHYLYDFLFQNCSSLIRDIVWEATSGRYAIPELSEEKHTYRSMMIPYLSNTPWLMIGEFVLLAYKTDRDAKPWDQMYLPDYMLKWFEGATDKNGESMVTNTKTLFLPRPTDQKKSFLSHPIFIITVIFILIFLISLWEVRRKIHFRFIDSTLFFLVGILGILMLYMWCCSKHLVTHQNINLMWAFPLHFLISVFVWIKGTHRFIRQYARLMSPLSVLFICFFWLLPQSIPLVVVIAGAMVSIRLILLADFPFSKMSRK